MRANLNRAPRRGQGTWLQAEGGNAAD